MAWTKIPKDHHPIFFDAVPDDPRVETIKMFGGVAGLVNGHMFGGLWANTVVVRLGDEERQAVFAMPGGGEFDPMGKGRVMKDMALLPEAIMADLDGLRDWLEKALTYTATLPPKKRKKKKKKVAAKKKAAPKKKKKAAKKLEPKKKKKKKAHKKKAHKKAGPKKKKKKKKTAKKKAGPGKKKKKKAKKKKR